MRKQLLFIAIAGLFANLTSAADLFVRENGTNGAYSTVTAAINAATNGDRIIIKPKTAGAAYVENLTVNKSLTFVSENTYEKYFIRGTVTIQPLAGRVVNIHNLSSGNFTIYNVVVSDATTGGRTTLNIYNSYLNNVSAEKNNTTLNISGCEVNGYIAFTHGKCTGNSSTSLTAMTSTLDANPATDGIEVIGNSTIYGISNMQKNYAFKFLNNFSNAIIIYDIKNGSANEIMNNTVYRPGGGDSAPIHVRAEGSGIISVMNNAVSFTGISDYGIENVGTATVNASYNIFTNAYVSQGLASQSNNIGGVNMIFNASSHTVTGGNANAGSPAVEYTDLDLTRNDAGNGGGSNSWSNYWPADGGNRAQINYLNLPRTFQLGGTLNVSGSGFSK